MAKAIVKTTKIKEVDTSIDMRLTKNDVVELLLQEELEALEQEHHRMAGARNKLRDKIATEIAVKFQKENANALKSICKSLAALWGTSVVLKVHNQYDRASIEFDVIDNARSAGAIDIPFSDEVNAELNEIEASARLAYDKLCNFKRDSKKSKAALTRKLLEQTEEGKALLANLSSVVVSLPSAK